MEDKKLASDLPRFLMDFCFASLLWRDGETLARDFVGQGRGVLRGISKITPSKRLTLQCRSPPIVTLQYCALGQSLFSGFNAKSSQAEAL